MLLGIGLRFQAADRRKLQSQAARDHSHTPERSLVPHLHSHVARMAPAAGWLVPSTCPHPGLPREPQPVSRGRWDVESEVQASTPESRGLLSEFSTVPPTSIPGAQGPLTSPSPPAEPQSQEGTKEFSKWEQPKTTAQGCALGSTQHQTTG